MLTIKRIIFQILVICIVIFGENIERNYILQPRLEIINVTKSLVSMDKLSEMDFEIKIKYPDGSDAMIQNLSIVFKVNLATSPGSDCGIKKSDGTLSDELQVNTDENGHAKCTFKTGEKFGIYELSVFAGWIDSDGIYHSYPEFILPSTSFNINVYIPFEVWNGTDLVEENGFVFIDKTPKMPGLKIKLKENNLVNNIVFHYRIEYTRDDREDHYFLMKEIEPDKEWNITPDMGNDIRGGKVYLSYNYNVDNESRDQLWSNPFIFYIRGKNPTEAEIKAEIGTSPWFITRLVRQESSYHHFNTGTPSLSDYNAQPNWGYPHGWGLFQLDDPRPNAQQLWD